MDPGAELEERRAELEAGQARLAEERETLEIDVSIDDEIVWNSWALNEASVEKDMPGLSFGAPEKKLGIKGSPTRELLFDNCVIPADRMVGERGRGLAIALQTLDHTRVTIGAQAIGIAQGALDAALDYVKQREQFGQRIADFQGVQFMLADMGMKLEAARQLVYNAAAKSERNDPALTYFGAAAKCFASDVAMEITTDAVQLFGGYGYMMEYPIAQMYTASRVQRIYGGTNEIMKELIARSL